jgi:transcriptional regulator with XRE-family HTH domain
VSEDFEPVEGGGDEFFPERCEAERHYMISLGQRIRDVREQRRMTQREAAIAAGVATDMISRLENGRYLSPGLRTLFRIAAGLGTTIGSLLPEFGNTDNLDARERLKVVCTNASDREIALITGLAQVVVQEFARHKGSSDSSTAALGETAVKGTTLYSTAAEASKPSWEPNRALT